MAYLFYSEIRLPNGKRICYSREGDVGVRRKGKQGMEIAFGEITEEKVNHAVPREFDAIMTWMGRALYPVCLTVDSSGKVKSILNWDEVRKRCREEGRRIELYYEQSKLVQTYVQETLKGASTEASLIECLSVSNFFQLVRIALFPNQDTTYIIHDFPSQGEVCTLGFQVDRGNDENETLYIATDKEEDGQVLSKEGTIRVRYNGEGFPDIIQMQCKIEVAGEGYYVRRVEIQRLEE